MGRKIKLEDISAIILAGGKGLRMGRDKASLPLLNETLLEHLAHQLDGHFKEIIISVSRGQRYPEISFTQVEDEFEDKGPLSGILSGLNRISSDVAFIVACDHPEIDLKIVEQMLTRIEGYDLVYLLLAGCLPHPLFALYRPAVVPVIKKLIEENKLGVLELLDRVKAASLSVPSEKLLWNLNTPEDYERYLEFLKKNPKKSKFFKFF
jgi:molybdopterin-guanine dinucleotide biosynthesis protein A